MALGIVEQGQDRSGGGAIGPVAPVSPPPLAIIGIGCLFPKADGSEAFWANIKAGVDAVGDIPETHWDPKEHFDGDPGAADMTYAKRGAFLEPVDFNPLEFGIAPNNLEATDTTQLLGMVAARQALLDAGYSTGKDAKDGRAFNRDRTSVILGVTGALELVIPLGARLGHPIWRKALKDSGVEKGVAEEVVQRISDSYVPWQENSFPGLLGNVAAGRIANRFDTGGTNCVVDAACASSLGALHMAAMELYAGRSDMAITGGIDTFNDIFMYMCFSKTPALSPTGAARPFSAGADGTILGEGLGVIVLKRLADAVRDGDKIRAVIRSIGSSSDGKGNAVYAPSASGQVKCLMSAYEQAGILPETIELVEAHGTGTKVGDAVEAKALNEVFRGKEMRNAKCEMRNDGGETGNSALSTQHSAPVERGAWCALGSVKSMVGHTKAAAGIAGLIKGALALENKVLPPTIKVERPLEGLESGKGGAMYVNTEKRPWVGRAGHPRRAGVSAFGFGGSNFHCVLEEGEKVKKGADWDDSVLVVPIGAGTREELVGMLKGVDVGMGWKGLREVSARMRAKFMAGMKFRLVMVLLKGVSDFGKCVRGAVGMLEKHPEKGSWNTPEGVYFGSGEVKGKVGVLFPGQGSQYVGMMRDLACQFPEMLEGLEMGDGAFGKRNGNAAQRLSDFIYPIPVFTEEGRKGNERAIGRTEIAQPALGAVSVGAWRVLEHFGVKADALGGHSFGELTALWAAGRMEVGAMLEMACVRGLAMSAAAGKGGAGGMLAVSCGVEEVEGILREEKLGLVVANKNGPRQVVLSGVGAEIERAVGILEGRGLRVHRLSVSAAFHSALVSEARVPFAEALKGIAIEAGRIPVYANTTGDLYPLEGEKAKGMLAGQLARPVEFVGEIEKMYEAGVRTFIEVGPGGKLSGLVRSILGERVHETVAMDASSGKRPGLYDLGCCVAQLAASGHGVELTRWDAAFAARVGPVEVKKPVMAVKLSGANYVKPRAELPARKVVEVKATSNGTSHVSERKGLVALNQQSEKVSGGEGNGNVSGKAQALAVMQQSIAALQRMQEQTAQLHQRYLEGQELAQRTIHQLVEQQIQMLGGAVGVVFAPLPEVKHDVKHEGTKNTKDHEEVVVRASVPVVSAAHGRNGVGGVHSNGHGVVPKVVPVVELPKAAPLVVVKTDDRAKEVLLEVVAEKTGYPVEMLELDMSLDGDLGIDSIKRVEILSALQTRLPEAPVVRPEDLGRLLTLREIVVFLDGAEKTETRSHEVTKRHEEVLVVGSVSAKDGESQRVLLEVVADKTGYPVEMLELDMSLDGDLGIDSIKRVEILSALQTRLPAAPVVRPEDLGRLLTLRAIVSFLEAGGETETRSHEVTKVHEEVLVEGKGKEVGELDRQVLTVVPLEGNGERVGLELVKGGVVWVTDEGAGLAGKICAAFEARGVRAEVVELGRKVTGKEVVAGLLIVAPAHSAEGFIQGAFGLIQRVGPSLRKSGNSGGAFLASASGMDGCFALNGHTPRNAMMGGLAGLVKTAAHEWPEVACKSLDLSHELHEGEGLAEQIVEEILLRGPAEVGISKSGRCETRLVRKSLNGEVGKNSLDKGDVVVITGGARGVTAAVSLAVARAYGCKLLLLGRSAAPTDEPVWLAGLRDEQQIKKACSAQMNGSATPRGVEEKYRKIMGNREIVATLKQIEEAGGTVMYRSLDVRDSAAVAAAVAEARAAMGPIRGIIHGAGVLQDRLIEQKTAEQFDEVFSTKVGGFQALLDAVEQDELKVIVAFSSSTGRFGRKGQVAYAAANEVLNKLAQREAHQRPGCRVLSMNWGPWEGGMVTPQLRRIFENEGVGLIPLEAGAEYLVREMSTPAGGPVEIVILGGKKAEDGSRETGDGRRETEVGASMTVAFERDVSVETHPFLTSHVMKGRAVLPAAVMVEWMAHGAMHEHPGMMYQGFDDFRIFKGVTLKRGEMVSLRVLAGAAMTKEGVEFVPVELRSGAVLHARATIVLGGKLATGEAVARDVGELLPLMSDEIYGEGRLFHGAAMQGITAVEGWSEEGIVGQAKGAGAPSGWMKQPLRSAWVGDPLAMDVAFQLMILWCMETRGVGSLPTGAGRYRQFVKAFPAAGTKVVIRVARAGEHAATAAVDFVDMSVGGGGKLVASMENYECVMDATLKAAFAGNELAH